MEDLRQSMLDEVMAADFALVDLQLYLNTHPNDERAICIYMNQVIRAKCLRCQYEKNFGPITATESRGFPWPWIKSPWPWEWQ